MPTNLPPVRIVASIESALSQGAKREHLRCHELTSTTKRLGGTSAADTLLAESVTSELNVSIRCQENVVQP
jgi:hypothetical protein